ncbi:mechanosensitive ion channel family protein [Aestuariicella hydrocarbonica]|uniref:Small-conductance mechanosensitive channel n=1 Tax=Pseudomaricurvus hydrocarbonicus TaxID=1470433 RepID=A0A9E5T495_9GAMM|nr:mechanosensitive ion channel family protein [Aestuariicella hydrocarbonica]NHO67863.1 mechanosensitive ion channel family protein [Aestuariicella hydrocarbonica]
MADFVSMTEQLTRDYGYSLLLLLVAAGFIKLINLRSLTQSKHYRFRNQILVIVLVLLAGLGLVLTLPLDSGTRGQLLTLMGLVFTAVLTLSSPTVAANAMAGFMIRSENKFSPGDFIQVNEYFGRVTEQGLFQTEIQTEDRDLLSVPNLFISSHPVKVVHADGTVVSAEVTLGYDVDHHLIEAMLLQAATDANLEEPFVYVMDLGDYSVKYRVAGFLKQVKHLLSSRSMLRKKMMDRLHEQNIEIVSPAFMNQRQINSDVIPQRSFVIPDNPAEIGPESLIFDKAERAQQLNELKESYNELKLELKAMDSGNEPDTDALKSRKLRRLKALKRAIAVLDTAQTEG